MLFRSGAIAKVVLNDLYKHTQLQDTFGANMLALVDGVPRTLRLDEFIRYYIEHQIEVIVRRSKFRLAEKEKRAHILQGYLKALDAIDEVIKLIRASADSDTARTGLMKLLKIDELQANAILDMQLHRLTGLEQDKLQQEFKEILALIAQLQSILDNFDQLMQVIKDELIQIRDDFGDARKTQIVDSRSDFSRADLIPEQTVEIGRAHV